MKRTNTKIMLGALGMLLVGHAALAAGDASDRWIGRWEIQATATYSTCSNVDVGDIKVIQLTIGVQKGELHGFEKAEDDQRIDYDNRSEDVSAGLFLHAMKGGGHVTLELAPNGSGRRVIANASDSEGACAIIYNLKAKKK